MEVFEFEKLVNSFNDDLSKIKNKQIIKFIKSFDYLEIYSLIQKNFPNAKIKFLFFSDLKEKKNFVTEFSKFLNLILIILLIFLIKAQKLINLEKKKVKLYIQVGGDISYQNIKLLKIQLIIPKSILNILSTLGVRKYNLSDYKDEIMKKK